jgi:hypothetical protein
MTLLEMLTAMGDRLGLLEMSVPQNHEAGPKIQTRTISLAELTTQIRPQEISELADLPAELSVPFAQIYESAGVKVEAHGWTVERLAQALPPDRVQGENRQEIQKKLLTMLASQGVGVEDIVKDAVARDRALDEFEKCVRKKLEERLASREHRRAELLSKIQQFQAELASLMENNKVEEQKWQEWKNQKRAAERELARTVGYFIDRPVITTDD